MSVTVVHGLLSDRSERRPGPRSLVADSIPSGSTWSSRSGRPICKNAAFIVRSDPSKPAVLRPHAKTHKCPVIARRQMELGAAGICVAKVSEAEVMMEAGINKILVTSPVVTTRARLGQCFGSATFGRRAASFRRFGIPNLRLSIAPRH